jgi:hypothetical protein
VNPLKPYAPAPGRLLDDFYGRAPRVSVRRDELARLGFLKTHAEYPLMQIWSTEFLRN